MFGHSYLDLEVRSQVGCDRCFDDVVDADDNDDYAM